MWGSTDETEQERHGVGSGMTVRFYIFVGHHHHSWGRV